MPSRSFPEIWEMQFCPSGGCAHSQQGSVSLALIFHFSEGVRADCAQMSNFRTGIRLDTSYETLPRGSQTCITFPRFNACIDCFCECPKFHLKPSCDYCQRGGFCLRSSAVLEIQPVPLGPPFLLFVIYKAPRLRRNPLTRGISLDNSGAAETSG